MLTQKIAILGAGNIGGSIASGLWSSGSCAAENIFLTRRRTERLQSFAGQGMQTGSDNREAVQQSTIIILAVEPKQVDGVLEEIRPALDPKRHLLISVATAVTIGRIRSLIDAQTPIVRAMPNTGIAIRESMTCICAGQNGRDSLKTARDIFNKLGQTLVINEEMMTPATALAACGIAFFLRAIRAASQGGIEIGFHAEDALRMAAQTARGAASLLLQEGRHPEGEIDKVTTPRGCTIAGLNQMEHEGFSSALIRGIITSAEKAEGLYG